MSENTMVAVVADELEIDGWKFLPEKGVIGIQQMNAFQRKQVVGDYQQDSNPILSSFIITDLSGGHGVEDLQEGADVARYSWGVVDARKPRQITLAPLVTKITGPGGTCRPVGVVGGNAIFAFATDLYRWDEDTGTVIDTADDLTAAPVAKAVYSKGSKLYIPLGADGYDTYDGSTVTNSTLVNAEGFVRWGSSLLAMDTTGEMHRTTDGLTWDDYGTEGTIDPAYDFRKLVPFRDRESFPMPIILTNTGLTAFDPAGPALYEIDDQLPPHEYHGLGAAVWGGELFWTAGMGVFRFNGSVRAPMGLDRDQGLPPDIRGAIVDLQDEQNGLYALVSGAASYEEIEETHYHDATTDEDIYVDPGSVVSSLHIFTSFGWHCYWTSEGAGGAPTWMMVTTLDGANRLWWGVGDDLYTMQLPFDFANARSTIESGTGFFAETSYLETGYFDAAMVSSTKIANTIVIRGRNCSADRTITVKYRVLGETSWVTLGTVTSDAATVFAFGDPDFYGVAQGVPFDAIQFRFEWQRGPGVSDAPLLRSAAFSYLKKLPEFISAQFRLDFSHDFNGKSPEEQIAKINSLMDSDYFYCLKYRDTVIRGRLSAAGGSDFTGFGENRGGRHVNFIEIPATL